jgi:predicted GTPase
MNTPCRSEGDKVESLESDQISRRQSMPLQQEPTRIVIMGAAGRDFHDFNLRFRDDTSSRVIAFTAAQIPDITDRRYPASLAGPLYPGGIPIYPETELAELIQREHIDQVYFCYSDLPHTEVMHRASTVLATGAGFGLLGPDLTMLQASVPVLSVCAVRTGVGKSALSRFIVRWLRDRGLRVSAVRHPMPYGDLEKQTAQRFADYEALDAAETTIEEREEYEPYLAMGATVFAGVDYAAVLARAELDADVVVWDGGNNDLPFFRPDLHVVMLDAHRPGHEIGYHPGEANFRMADVIVVNKVDSAPSENVEELIARAAAMRPGVPCIQGVLELEVAEPEAIHGARVVIVGDGPTLTHGGMATGAGSVAAHRFGAAEIIDARPFAVGSLAETFDHFPHLGPEVPAMGYSEDQIRDLEETLRRVPADIVLDATPAALSRRIHLDKPIINVEYHFAERGNELPEILERFKERFLSCESS